MSPLPDVLYILGTGSRWEDNELRYSLRSVAEYMPHRQVWIVGHCPSWVCGVRHLPATDRYGEISQANTVAKLTLAVAQLRRPFWLMADDIVLRAPWDEQPPMYHGTMAAAIERLPARRGSFWESLVRTRAALVAAGVREPLHYGVHAPRLLDPDQVVQTLERMRAHRHRGYHFPCAHGGLHWDGGRETPDFKLRGFWGAGPAADWPCVSTDDHVIADPDCRAALAAWYPEPSPYERAGAPVEI